jgi:hypothetical protein
MWDAAHAMMALAGGIEKDEVVIALELFVESSDSIHSEPAPAPALLLRRDGVSAWEAVRNQRKECLGLLL